MSITIDDDFDYTVDERRDADDDGPALRPGYVPPTSLGEGAGAFGAGTVGKDSEPFLTLRDPSRSTIDWNRFIRPATPEEIKAYDEWEERRAKQGMGAVISQVFQDRRQAWEQTPDQAAHRMWLERQTGIPQRMLQDGDVLRTAEMRAQMGMDALTLHDAPEQVVSWLKTPGMLEIARDDLETLKKAGDALQQLAASKAPTRPGNKWKDFRSGIADVLEGEADVREMQAAARMSPSVLEPEADVGTLSGVMGLGRGFLASLPKEVRKDVAASMSRAALSNADEWRSWAEWVRPAPYVLPKEGTFSRWLSDVVRGTPYTLTGMPVSAALTTGGAVLGGPLGATAGAALSSLIQTNGEAQVEQAHVWRELVDRGMDPAEAYDKSFNEVYLPNFGLLYLSNFLQDRLTFGVPMGRGAAYWVKRGGNLLLSSLFEGGEEIGQSLISNRALGEENDWGQLLYEGAVGVGVGLVFSGGGTALDTAMGRYREHRAEAGAARESTRIGAVMDEAVKAAEASKVRERSPEAFDDFVEYVGGQRQEKVNVDGAVFFQTFGKGAYAAAERLGIAEGLDEAARTGGAVEIPTAAILKNPDLYEKVKDDLRYSDDGMSRNEAQEYERTRGERNRADIDAAASAVRTVQEAGEKAERIRDGLRTQFEALGHKKVGKREAEFYSTIWTAALANEARYAGVDIEEMARRPEWNLRFQYDRGTGDISRMRGVYTHPVNAGVDLGQKVPILDLSGKIPDAQRATPQELLDFLKAEFVGKEPSISADGEAMIGLPSNSAAKHVVRSSWKGLTYEDMDTRTAGLMSLRDVLQNATLVESSPNQKSSKTHLKNIHRFYIPVWSSDGLKTLRIVAHESKNSDGRTPVEVDLNDLIVERQNESPARLSGTPLSGVLPERQLRGASEVTIADMLRGVKDAGGRPYVGEEYRQFSVRQSEDYDYSDPKTWPEGPGRDEALMLEAWQNFEPDGEIETWPESPEKTEALALREEYGEIETWVENLSREEFDRMLWSDDPEFVRKNERGEEIENRLRVLARRLRKKKPKGAEGRLLQLIEAEEESAAREAETYYQRQAEEKLAQDEKAWATLIDRFLDNELSGKEKGAPLPVMTTPLVLSLTGVEVLPVEIHARNLDKILNGKHEIAPETLKQLPRAIADPIMIFRSPADESKGRDSRVILTELTEKDAGGEDRSIVAAITLKRANTRHGYEINELTTVFRKDVSSRQNLTPELDVLDWMTRRHKDGSPMNLLLYLNRNKGLEWLDHTGTSPKASSLFQDPYVQSVPNEADLDNLRASAPGFYQDATTPLGSTRFGEAETIVTILKDGNRSTFLHELGHVFLNSRRNLALMEGIDETVRQDWTTLVEWLEVADIDFSKPLSETDEKRWRNAHEKFAAGFEKYLMEGRAPNLDLARAFRAFRKWLTDIYKAVRNVFYVDADGNRVEFEINDEIRGVMDRMLASEEEIEESRAVQEAERLAHILTEQGIPDDVAERYRDAVAAGADAARAKLYKKLTAELKAEKQAELKEARKAAHKQAGAEVWDLPEYRALKALLTPRDKGGLRLSMPELIALYGDAGAEALARELPVGVLANDGLPLAEAVELLGYGTPEALLEDLKRAKKLPPQQAVADRVRTATAQLESLIHDPEALRAEAERIMHGRERLEWLALETEMLDEAAHRLGKKIGEDARREEGERERQRERDQNRRAEEDLRGVFGPENLAAMAQAAEAEAERIIAGKRMRDISVSHYMAAEKRASAKALQAAAGARFEEARQWKRTELINHALAIEAMNVREEYEKGRKLLERYWPNRKRLRGVIGNEAFNQIIGLLERLGVNPEDPAAKDRPRLDEYLNDLAKKRETTPPVARWLRDLDIRDARASLANLTPEQFEDVTKAVTALDKIGRLENKLLTAQRNETFAETVERLRAATEKQHGLPGAQSRATDQKGVGLFAGALASLDRVETLLRQADGLEEQGAFWETIYLPAQRAYEAELVKGKAAKEAIEGLLDKHFKDKKAFTRFLNEKLDTGMIDPGTEKKLYWTGENLLCAMLNWGNQHNRERLVYGNGLRENAVGSTERPADDVQYYAEYEAGKAVAEAIFNRLSNDAMWDFCQDVWDYLDTFWPEIQALEERLNGAAPEKVEATPIRTASGKVLRGGYYPVRFDANADWTAFVHNEQESVKALYEDQTHRPGTRKGHTKERVERVAPRQLLLSLDVIAEHTANVVHDLTHREAVRDLYKLIHDDAVRGLLTHAVGRAGFEQFSPWIQSLAAPSTPTDKADRVFSKAMGNAAAVQLGLNMVSSVGQTVSLVPAAWKLGLRRVVPAVLNTLTLRGFWDSKYRDFAFALSPELADRINGTDRNIRAALDLERSGARKRALSGAKAALYVALGWADMAVSLPVWHAAYEKGMARWNDQRKAVDYANYVVRTTNNAGAAKDLAQVQRGGPTRRLFTMYYSAFGSLYQMFHEQMTRAGREGIPGKIKLAAFCFMMFTVQSALEDLVKGRAPLGGDDDDDKSVGKWLIQGTLLSASSMFPIVRDIASGTTLLGGTGKFRPSPALEAGSAFIKAVDSGAKVVTDAWNGEDVEAERVVKNMVEAGGYAFGLPSVQLLRWYKTFVRWANGEPDWSPWELIWHKRGR